MYLVAVKSFYRSVGAGQIVIVDDGTLSPDDRQILARHLGSPEFIDLREINTGPYPRGGTWERILKILDMLESNYVIQLDCDTVTRGPIPEVLECIHSNKCFALGTLSRFGTRFVSLAEASEFASDFQHPHVQNAAEKNLARISFPEQRRYVRGSSGFAGFAKGIRLHSLALEFSNRMFELIGQKWTEWGSEQVMSNYLVANSPAAAVLPYPKYSCFDPDVPLDEATFLHFIGSYRYMQGVYSRESRAVIGSNFKVSRVRS